ncbi:MAG: ATP-dependent sacrificial sulfur transferase LarE [Pirellulaceae bacterium]
MSDTAARSEQVVEIIRSWGDCAVAFSAGVDSTVVAKAAHLALGDRAVAVTGRSPSLAEGELQEARDLAQQIGIRHVIVDTSEFNSPDYTRNDANRCYYCKTELYDRLDEFMEQLGVRVVLNGANVDDAGDYRPGERAASEHYVRSPLAECGFTKEDVRALAAYWELPVWDKPAMPCLASRIAYGEEVTPERMAMVDRAERFLRDRGMRDVRVRYHRGDLARVEVPTDDVPRILEGEFREALILELQSAGFKFVTLDLEGLRSGSLNRVIPVDLLRS